MICYGVTSGISSFALSVAVKWLSNAFLVAFGFFLHLSLMVWLLLWDKSQQLVISFYIAGGLLGVCEAVWAAVTNGMLFRFFFYIELFLKKHQTPKLTIARQIFTYRQPGVKNEKL